MIEMYLDPQEDHHFSLRRHAKLEGVDVRISITHLEIREMLAGNAAVMAVATGGHSYTLYSDALSNSIREADEITRRFAIPVRAPSLAAPKVRLRHCRQFFAGTWVSYTREHMTYSRLDQAVVSLTLGRAKVARGDYITANANPLRRHCFSSDESTPEHDLVWETLTRRLRTGKVPYLITTEKGIHCPRCLSRHVLLSSSKGQCLECLHESHHHAENDPEHRKQKRALD